MFQIKPQIPNNTSLLFSLFFVLILDISDSVSLLTTITVAFLSGVAGGINDT